MVIVRAYHRPSDVDEALSLLESGEAVVLGGGTMVGTQHPAAVVDLQALGLDAIDADAELVTIGAMVRLQSLVDGDPVPPLLRDLARREAPSTFRNAATMGGTIGTADPESELLAGLLVHEATVTIARSGGEEQAGLDDVLSGAVSLQGGIITAVRVVRGGDTTAARAGRTPADRPIVMVAGRRGGDGEPLLAATGVATTPILVTRGAIEDLQPPADFRGSAEYRRHLAKVLVGRVMARLEAE